jgi:RNA polymerase sigma-70 factor (ECF subfamily)
MWPDAEETQALLRRVAERDPTAADRLWERHREPFRRLIDLRLDPALERRLDASDVVQDVLLEANRRLPDYLRDPALPFHLWLRRIARDHLVDQHRRHRGAVRRSLDRERPAALSGANRSSFELAGMLRDPELTPAAHALRLEMFQRFQAALAELDEVDRDVLLMRHFEGLSNQEVARALGLTEPAAGMRHVRALRRLHALLGGTSSVRSL